MTRVWHINILYTVSGNSIWIKKEPDSRVAYFTLASLQMLSIYRTWTKSAENHALQVDSYSRAIPKSLFSFPATAFLAMES